MGQSFEIKGPRVGCSLVLIVGFAWSPKADDSDGHVWEVGDV